MQNFTQSPTDSKLYDLTQFVHADGTPDIGFTAPVTYTTDQPTLAKLSNDGIGSPANEIRITPLLPAAQNGGVLTISGTFTNENGALVTQSFTVTITAAPNPAAGFQMAQK